MQNQLNIGSIQKIEVTPAQFVTISNQNEQNKVTVTNRQEWKNIQFSFGTATFEEAEKQVDEGILYQTTLNWNQPKISPDNHADIFQYKNKPVIIKITDGNGNTLLIGEPNNPARIITMRKIPNHPSGFNGYYSTVKMKNTHPAYFVA